MFWLTILYVIGRGARPASQQQTFWTYKGKAPRDQKQNKGGETTTRKIYKKKWQNSTNANPDYYLLYHCVVAAAAVAVHDSTISTLHQHHHSPSKALHLYHSHSRLSLFPSDIPFFNHNKTNFTIASKSTWKWMDGVAEKREEKIE